MAVQTKGGFPVTRRITISDAPADADAAKRIAPARTIHLRIRNNSANEVRIYWTEEDFTAANTNYTSILTTEVWTEPAEIVSWWPIAIGGAAADVEVTYFARRA